jgi:glycosyltransferase involved in cell wall biosynthesis
MTGAKFIYDSHELWSDPDYPTYQHFPRLIFRLAVGLERFLAHRADAVITVSDGIAECMSRNIGISKPLVIRNLPNRSEIACRHREHRLHEALGLEAQIPVILHLGALDRDRGIEMLLSALPFVAPPAVAVCLGSVESESYLQSLQRRARELGIEERIYFRESVPAHDVCAYASGAAVGVSLLWCNRLNNRFALPNKLFEYLQASLPVVVNGPSERQALVDTYDVGESFTDGNVMALAEALNIMLTDEKRVERYRVNALRAARELNWEKEELRLMQIYRRLAPNTHCLNADPALEVK